MNNIKYILLIVPNYKWSLWYAKDWKHYTKCSSDNERYISNCKVIATSFNLDDESVHSWHTYGDRIWDGPFGECKHDIVYDNVYTYIFESLDEVLTNHFDLFLACPNVLNLV